MTAINPLKIEYSAQIDHPFEGDKLSSFLVVYPMPLAMIAITMR